MSGIICQCACTGSLRTGLLPLRHPQVPAGAEHSRQCLTNLMKTFTPSEMAVVSGWNRTKNMSALKPAATLNTYVGLASVLSGANATQHWSVPVAASEKTAPQTWSRFRSESLMPCSPPPPAPPPPPPPP
eukprot:COSAG04_NODE_5118_length_1730_cov_1.179031_3_plen_129_part_01